MNQEIQGRPETAPTGGISDHAQTLFFVHGVGCFIAPFLIAGGVAGGGIEVELSLVEVHGGNLSILFSDPGFRFNARVACQRFLRRESSLSRISPNSRFSH